MTSFYIKNAVGTRFLIEGASDIDDNGRFVQGSGWFASPVKGDDILSGVWFETKAGALSACYQYRGEV